MGQVQVVLPQWQGIRRGNRRLLGLLDLQGLNGRIYFLSSH